MAQATDPANWPWHVRNINELRAFVEGLGKQTYETLLALYLDGYLNLLAVEAFDGDATGVTVPIGRILCRGRALGATALILVHNHPSGDPTPSMADRAVTRRIAAAAEAMDITLVEHAIIAGDRIERMAVW